MIKCPSCECEFTQTTNKVKESVFSRFSRQRLEEMDGKSLEEHETKVWTYWTDVNNIKKYKALKESGRLG